MTQDNITQVGVDKTFTGHSEPTILRLDGTDYDLSRVSPEARELVVRLKYLEQMAAEKRNLSALLTKAKNAYIADLKSEVIKKRSGVDLSTLFDQE